MPVYTDKLAYGVVLRLFDLIPYFYHFIDAGYAIIVPFNTLTASCH